MITLTGLVMVKNNYTDEYGTNYTIAEFAVPRKSGTIDLLKIRCFGSIADQLEVGKSYAVEGSLRTYEVKNNPYIHTMTMVYPAAVHSIPSLGPAGINDCDIEGTIAYYGPERLTPKGTKLRDVTITTKRYSGDWDKIRCLLWGDQPERNIGEEIHVKGRFQSRNYMKNETPCVTYELSISEVL